MNRNFRSLLWMVAFLAMAGCSKEQVLPTMTIEMSAPSAGGARVKIVDEKALADLLVAVATKTPVVSEISGATFGDIFTAAVPVSGHENLVLDSNGRVKVAKLRPQQFVLTQAGASFWIVATYETRDRRLSLNETNEGGKHAYAALAARAPFKAAVAEQLRAAAGQAIKSGEFAKARNLATSAQAMADPDKAKGLLAEIDRDQATDLLARGTMAYNNRDYQEAKRLAQQAESLMPEQERLPVQRLIQKVLEEVGGELRGFTVPGSPATAVVMSPDGRYAVGGGADKSLTMWDVATARVQKTFPNRGSRVTALAFDAIGRQLVSGSDNGTVKLWDAAKGEELNSVGGLGWKISGLALHPNGQLALVAGDDTRLMLWDLKTGRQERAFGGHAAKVNCVVFSADGQTALSGSQDNTMKLWNVAGGSVLKTFSHGVGAVTCVAFTPDGLSAVSGCTDGQVRLWNLARGNVTHEMKGQAKPVRGVAVSTNGRLIFSASEDGLLKLWDAATGKEVQSVTGKGGVIRGASWSRDCRNALTCGDDATIKLWQLPDGTSAPMGAASK